MLYGLILFGLSFLQAGQDLIGAARQHPESASASHLAGEYYLQRNEFASAVPYLENARRIDSTNYINSYDLALAYLQIGSLDKSRQLIGQLIEQENKAELHNLLGDVEEAAGHVDEAAHEYETAARMDPTEKNLFDLGSDLLNHRGFQPALTVFQYAAKTYPASARLRVGLGVSYYSLGSYDDAVRTLCEAFDLDPADTKALDFLGKMHDVSPQYAEEVRKRLALFARRYPSNAAAQYFYALSLKDASAAGGQEAVVHLLRAIALKPDYPEAHYALGVLYQEQGRYQKAAAQLEIAAAQQPSNSPVHYHLAQVYRKLGLSAQANREFAKVNPGQAHQ